MTTLNAKTNILSIGSFECLNKYHRMTSQPTQSDVIRTKHQERSTYVGDLTHELLKTVSCK